MYAIAQQVKWYCPEEFKNHILRLGGFHTLCSYISCIGKLWGDAGLSELLAGSDVCVSGTVDQMLLGKKFNHGVRGFSLAF